MARGDECKTTTKANNACKHLDVAGPIKKPVLPPTSFSAPKKPEQKSYGNFGPIFKDKKNFTEMHFC